MAPILPSSALNATGHTTNGTQASGNCNKPIILHLGDPIVSNHDLHARLKSNFTIERPNISELHRSQFIKHLKNKTWGDFSAILRPFWNTGAEMGRWDRELIELLPRSMKVMASAGAGFDWVDTETLGEYGILYANGAGASTESVADMALYFIINVFRRMTWSSLAARSNNSADFQKAHRQVMFESHNPRNHTLGIVGLGNIGFAIAKKVRVALGMEILYHDKVQKSPVQEDEVAATYFSNLDEMLGRSDCILLASPGGPIILNAHRLSLLRRGSRVVNIARGSLIDEDALVDALENGQISAAALDVHTNEPHVHPRLSQMWNVELTSHTGGSSVDTIEGFERLVLENVEAVLTGREPLTAVNTHFMRRATDGVNGHQHSDGEVAPVNGDHRVNGNH